MKKISCIALAATLCGLVILIPGLAAAAEFSFQPRLEAGVMSYSFESDAISANYNSFPIDTGDSAIQVNTGGNMTQSGYEINDFLPYLGIGGSLFTDRFFIDVSGQFAINGNNSITTPYSAFVPTTVDSQNQFNDSSYLAAAPMHSVEFDRRDIAVSLGYPITRRCSLFAGYKWAETQFNSIYRGPLSNVIYSTDGNILNGGGEIYGKVDFRFSYAGPFVGAVQGWEFHRYRFLKGTLTASLALAYLEGKVKLKDNKAFLRIDWVNNQATPPNVIPLEDGGVALRQDTKGDSFGLMLGIGWRGEMPIDGLSYFLGVNGYRYEFNAERRGAPDINESAFILKGGITYNF